MSDFQASDSLVYPIISKKSSKDSTLPYELGQALVFITALPALASMQMSSRFDIIVSANTDEAIRESVRDLRSFLFISVFWIIGTTIVMYIQFSWRGLFINLFFELVVLVWITLNFWGAINTSVVKYNLNKPSFSIIGDITDIK